MGLSDILLVRLKQTSPFLKKEQEQLILSLSFYLEHRQNLVFWQLFCDHEGKVNSLSLHCLVIEKNLMAASFQTFSYYRKLNLLLIK